MLLRALQLQFSASHFIKLCKKYASSSFFYSIMYTCNRLLVSSNAGNSMRSARLKNYLWAGFCVSSAAARKVGESRSEQACETCESCRLVCHLSDFAGQEFVACILALIWHACMWRFLQTLKQRCDDFDCRGMQSTKTVQPAAESAAEPFSDLVDDAKTLTVSEWETAMARRSGSTMNIRIKFMYMTVVTAAACLWEVFLPLDIM